MKSTAKINAGEPPGPAKRSSICPGTLFASSPHPPIAASPVGISSTENTMINTLCNASLTAAAAMPPNTMYAPTTNVKPR